MPRVKKAEREAVVNALDDGHDSADEAAQAAIIALDALREQELAKSANRPWVVLAQIRGQSNVYTYGPYPTESRAQRALKSLSSPGPEPMVARVQKLFEVSA